MPRLFTGIELPEDVRAALSSVEQPLPGADWIDEDDLHVTLRFFGDVSAGQARDLADLLETSHADAMILTVGALATFGTEPHTLYASVTAYPAEALEQLARSHDRIARGLGLGPRKHPFRPHITLARLKHADPARVAAVLSRAGAMRLEPFFVHRTALFTSRPGTGGGPYLVEATYPLRGGLGAGEDADGNPW